jgi:transposase
LAKQNLPGPLSESVPQILRLMEVFGQELAISEKYLTAVEPQFPEVTLLRTLPGIGAILAPVIWSEIGRIERFASAAALVNYTGMVPSLYESGEVSVRGHITHQGSPAGAERSSAVCRHCVSSNRKAALCASRRKRYLTPSSLLCRAQHLQRVISTKVLLTPAAREICLDGFLSARYRLGLDDIASAIWTW